MQNTRVKKYKDLWFIWTILLLILLLLLIALHFYFANKSNTNINAIKLICEPKVGIKDSVVYEAEVDTMAEIKSVHKKKYDAEENMFSDEDIGDIYLNGTPFYQFAEGLGNDYQCYEK